MCVRRILFTAGCLLIGLASFAQSSNYSKVYRIFKTNCTNTSCHDKVSPTGNMSLEGTESEVYNNLVGVTPTNSYADSMGYSRINPGDPHTSFLFRKINQGFDAHIILDTQEVDPMPSAINLTDEEKETIRQWILHGAMQNGTSLNSFDTLLIQDYYTNGGVESMPTAPPAPDSADGFQIHMGPFFVAKGQELEYYLKYDPKLSTATEIYRVDMLMGGFSHHFILNRFKVGEESSFSDGYRRNGSSLSSVGITSAQFADTMILPAKTAFYIPANSWFDLNSHYINFSSTQVLKAEVYINIYTQDAGTAVQIMYSTGQTGALDPPSNILYVPNDGNTYTFEDEFYQGSYPISLNNDIYVWRMTSHTHQWGTDFQIFRRNTDDTRGVMLYDGANIDGIPNGTSVGFDYAHPPTLIFDPFIFIPKNEGFIFEASYVNNGPAAVTWGITSEDEMFIMGVFAVLDTTGLFTGISPQTNTSFENKVSVFPNPFNSTTTFRINYPDSNIPTNFILLDLLGKEVFRINNVNREFLLERGNLKRGAYIYKLMNSDSFLATGTLVTYYFFDYHHFLTEAFHTGDFLPFLA